jgi:hypothetical protein
MESDPDDLMVTRFDEHRRETFGSVEPVRAPTIVAVSSTVRGVLPSRVLAERREEVLDLVGARGASNVRLFGSIARV